MSSNKKMIEMDSEDLTSALQNMLFVFGGEDSGVSFLRLCNTMRKLEEKNNNKTKKIIECFIVIGKVLEKMK